MKNPIFIDFEASSLSVAHSYPIEIAFTSEKDGENLFYSKLIKPVKNWLDWSVDAENLHGISLNDLMHYGENVKKVAKEVNSILSGEVVFADGGSYDQMWCRKLFEAAGIEPEFKIKDLMYALSEEQVNNWDKVKNNILRRTQMPLHRAGNDVILMNKVFNETLDIENRNRKFRSLYRQKMR